MKNLLTKITGLIALGMALNVKSADYGIAKTFWNYSSPTNLLAAAAATNVASALDATLISDFSLQVFSKATNNTGGAGGFDILWETSLDGTNWPNETNQVSRTVGWFRAPINSNAVNSVWVTNITVDAIGYWRIRYITNQSNMAYTNVVVRAYAKPKRTNRDY